MSALHADHLARLLKEIKGEYPGMEFSPRVLKGFQEVPRHLFVKRFRQYLSPDWMHVDRESLPLHLDAIYENEPLIIEAASDQNIASTVSKPSVVLAMLQLLSPGQGETVLEVGAGSGWNAALLSSLVGPDGRVISCEINERLAYATAENMKALGFKNVTILPHDIGIPLAGDDKLDKVIFTVGSYELPEWIFSRMKENGVLLAVQKIPGGGDLMLLLRKTRGTLEYMDSMQCGFVPLTGVIAADAPGVFDLEQQAYWPELNTQLASDEPFYWGLPKEKREMVELDHIRFFLWLKLGGSLQVYRGLPGANVNSSANFFGIHCEREKSLLLCRPERITAFGNRHARDLLIAAMQEWVARGMPTLEDYTVRIMPIRDYDASMLGDGQYLVRGKNFVHIYGFKGEFC